MKRSRLSWLFGPLLIVCLVTTHDVRSQSALDDLSSGFIHLSPAIIHTTNGCSQFTIGILGTFTDARVFSLRFYFDSPNLQLLSVTPAADTSLHLMPYLLSADTLWIDGFFHPNRTGVNVLLAQLHCKAISAGDYTALVGFLSGEGYGGVVTNPDTLIFSGDTSVVFIEGTAPLPPEHLIVQSPPHPAHDDSLRLCWRSVMWDEDGDPVVNPLYHVYFRNIFTDSTFLIAETPDTFIWDNAIQTGIHSILYDTLGIPIDTSDHGWYFVTSCKTQP